MASTIVSHPPSPETAVAVLDALPPPPPAPTDPGVAFTTGGAWTLEQAAMVAVIALAIVVVLLAVLCIARALFYTCFGAVRQAAASCTGWCWMAVGVARCGALTLLLVAALGALAFLAVVMTSTVSSAPGGTRDDARHIPVPLTIAMPPPPPTHAARVYDPLPAAQGAPHAAPGMVETGVSAARLVVCWAVIPLALGAPMRSGSGEHSGAFEHNRDLRVLVASMRACEASRWCALAADLLGCPLSATLGPARPPVAPPPPPPSGRDTDL